MALEDEARHPTASADDRPPSWRRGPKLALALAIAGAVALALVFAVGSTLSLGVSTARADLEERLSELTGRPVFVDGAVSFELLPRPLVTLADVRVGTGGAGAPARLDIDHVQAQLDFLDALVGRTDIARLTLIRPEISGLDGWTLSEPATQGGTEAPDARPADSPQRPEASGDHQVVTSHLRSFFNRFEGVRTIEIRDGVFRPEEGGSGVSNANLDFTWPSRDEAARLIGSYVWNGQPSEIDLSLGAPIAFLDGEPSALALTFSAPSLQAAFEGTGSAGPILDLAGELRLTTPSISRAARWLGDARPPLPDFGALTLDTQLHLFGSRVNMTAVSLGVGGFVGHGAMEAMMGADGRPAIGGTLAFDRLEFDGLARAIAPLPRNALDLQRPMAVSFVEAFDLDLRLSASEAVLAAVPLRELAATVKFAKGIATLDIGDADVLGGRAQGRLTVDTTLRRPKAQARIALMDVDAAGLATLAGIDAIAVSGRSDLNATFEGPVTSWGDVARDNEVRATLTIADGNLTGIDPQIFLQPGRKRLTVSEGSAVPFASLYAELRTAGAYATFQEIRMEGERGEFVASGLMSLLDDTLAVDGTFRPVTNADEEAAPAFTSSQPIRFNMQGEWPRPIVTVGSGVKPI